MTFFVVSVLHFLFLTFIPVVEYAIAMPVFLRFYLDASEF